MKKRKIITAGICVLAAAALAGCAQKAPDAITAAVSELVLSGTGDTADISELIKIEGDAEAKLKYSVSDESILNISDDGIVTAADYGAATVVISAQADENVYTSIDVLVADYMEKYTVTKYIDAMGCDIKIDLTLNKDGTFDYYRYPMNVQLEGGGEMDGLTDQGTYTVEGNKVNLKGDYLGEYTLELKLNLGEISLNGSIPTGGAATQVQMNIERG